MNKVEQIAKTCHEVNKAYCESIGDMSQPSWEDAPDWQKQSAINGVKFHLENPNSLPCDSHNNWMAEKLKEGWVYGEVKNPEKKEHPCMVEYNELPVSQQTKDLLFISVVRSFERKNSEPTLGQETVHADFNPSKYAIVDQIKEMSADLIDLTESLKSDSCSGEKHRAIALARTHFETGCMFAVKANFKK